MLNPALLPGGDGVRLSDLGDPGPPAEHQVRVRMLRMPINPADLLAIDGAYAFPVDPNQPLGAEGIGRLEAVGSAVTTFARDDLVLPLDRGSWCAVRLAASDRVVKLPSDADSAQAAMLRINPATAWLMLALLALRPGETIVQNAAGSAVARWVRIIAKARGVAVIDVVRRPLPGLAGALVDGPDLADRVLTLANGPVSAALDCVAGSATGRLAACLAPRGRLLLFGHLSGQPVAVPSRLMTAGALIIEGFSLRPAEQALGREGVALMFDEVLRLAAASPPPQPVAAVFPFEQAADALAMARAGQGGRVQLEPAISDM